MAPRSEWFDTDFYAVLGVKSKATDKEITKAYRKLARKYHPDASGGDEERFKKISAAYAVLGNDEKRTEYDEARRLGAGAFGAGPGNPRGYASGPGDPYGYTTYTSHGGDDSDFRNIFTNLFGRGSPGNPGTETRINIPMKGVDFESSLALSFRNAVDGITTTISLSANPSSGIAARRVKVRIPRGVDDGQRIRIPGKGGAGRNGGPNGDLYVVVKVKPDPTFGRKGAHLTTTVPITFAQAALGTDLRVKTYDANTVTLKVPAGTNSGSTFRVKGRGVKARRTTGDLLVTTKIEVPKKLSARERGLLEQLASVESSSGAS